MFRPWRTFAIFFVLTAAAACGPIGANHESRGDRYYLNGYYDDSLAEYLMAEKTRGVSADLLRKIGKVYVMKGDFFQAKKYFDRYFSLHDAEPDAEVLLDYLQVAVERGRAGDTTMMVHALEEILQINPNYSLGRFYFDLGEYYYNLPDYHRAIAYFLQGMPLDVDVDRKATYLLHLAMSYEKLEDWFNAYLYFDQFISLYPDQPEIEQVRWHKGSCAFPLARQAFDQGDLEQAFSYLDEIIGTGQPQNLVDDAWLLKGDVLLADKRPEEAKQAYRQVLRLNRYYWKEKIAEQARKKIEELEFNREGSF
ncbi:MAG: tetratricopeptide repeat protein [Candidatus Glassbacteria bacterium]